MIEAAGWIAPIATMIAAMMTAANLGARTTGWGFVVFTAGSVCWATVGLSTGQTNLVATNVFLTLVNLVGIWRWLGRQRAYEDGGKAAQTASSRLAVPTLFTTSSITGMEVRDADSNLVGKSVEALVECQTGKLSYVVVASGGVGGIAEELRAVSRQAITFETNHMKLLLTRADFESIAPLAAGNWPARAPVPEALTA
ncbi:MAG: PRC-barrel domain-containing protein [Pseudomonadota bacterium]|nr:PRC-barrel domain-containing protein [Pseudomonadota bacterium]